MLQVERASGYGGVAEGLVHGVCKELEQAVGGALHGQLYMDETHFQANRQILLDLNPYVLSPREALAEYLVSRGVAALLDFRPIDKHGLILGGRPCIIPRSKEDVMLDASLSLLEKRQLMRLMALTTGPDQPPDHLQVPFVQLAAQLSIPSAASVFQMLIYGIAAARTREEAQQLSVGAVALRVRQYVQSLERYGGNTALLYPHGGSNSIIQAICRAAAVSGAVQILDQGGVQLCPSGGTISGCFDGNPWQTRFGQAILADDPPESGEDSSASLVRAALILKRDSALGGVFGDEGCNLWVVPPDEQQSSPSPTIFILQVDAAAACCPPDHLLLYAWMHMHSSPALGFDQATDQLKHTLGQLVNMPPERNRPDLPHVLLAALYPHRPSEIPHSIISPAAINDRR